MKKMKKTTIFFGAVATVLLLISSATALVVTEPGEEEISTYGNTGESLVDPDIYLDQENLATLCDSLQYIDNEDVYALVEAIIQKIQEQGYVTGGDIQAIQDSLFIFLPVHAGRIDSGGFGCASQFPGFIVGSLFLLRWGFSILASFSGRVSGSEPIPRTYVNLILRYEGNHDGFIFGFLGWVGYPNPWTPLYSVDGWSPLIIIVPGNGCTVQSNPQTQPSTPTNPTNN